MPVAPTFAGLRNPVGTHVQVGKGLVAGALAERRSRPAPRRSRSSSATRAAGPPRPVTRRSTRRSGQPATTSGMRVFVHTPYLVNLGSPTPATYERSWPPWRTTSSGASEIGAEGVVVHTGSCVDEGTFDVALRQVREGLLPVLDALGEPGDGVPWLLLEPTAGQGRSLCAGVEDLAPYLDALDHHPAVGICLDTCHVFAAGAPLDEAGGTTATVDRLVEIAGAGRLRLVHANDSMDVRGAFKDRHQKIGDGYIGLGAFEELFAHPATDGVPFVLETPGSRDPEDPQIALLQKLRER